MIHHPAVLGPKLLFAIVAIIVLVVLHGSLPPDQFRVAVLVAIALFLVFSVGVWAIALKLLSNPESRVAKGMILSEVQQKEAGYHASKSEFVSRVGQRGKALSTLRPSGVALFEGKRVQVVTRGEYIDGGATIEVVEKDGPHVVVQAVEDAPDR